MTAPRVLVLGAGAAGLTAALRAAECGARVELWNAHPRPGLKILMSGGTRCNVTHREVSATDFHGGSRAVVARILRAFPASAAREWIESLGVPLKLEDTGKYFPVSDDAHDVLASLLEAVQQAGVTTRWGRRSVRLEPGASRFRVGYLEVRDSTAFRPLEAPFVRTEWPLPAGEPTAWEEADRVILATGGLSFPRTGSDGTGYALAVGLGHTVVPPVPALTPLISSDPICNLLQGLATDAEHSLGAAGPSLGKAGRTRVRGSLLFTHFGYSGPAALDVSRHWHRVAPGADREIRASFRPGARAEEWLAEWRRVAAAEPRRTVRQFVGDGLPSRLLERLCEEAGLSSSAPLSQISRERRGRFLDALLHRPLHVTGTLGFEKAECTAGGVPLAEVDSSTLESRLVPGLFLCGEILDVEGRLGGFNFQWAWSSGTVAGRAAGRLEGRVTAAPGPRTRERS